MTVTVHSRKPKVLHFLQLFVDFTLFFSVQTQFTNQWSIYYKQCCLITLGGAALFTSTVNQSSDPCATGYGDGLCVRGRNCRELERASSWQNRKLLAPAGWGIVGILSEVRASHYPRESRLKKKKKNWFSLKVNQTQNQSPHIIMLIKQNISVGQIQFLSSSDLWSFLS